ncbi:hypothetical protein P879_01368 [Paragonimus westermani]|uniref:Uncharacterized protein n=1 Tax=Paragonimus westermani TaxID=34504 RepID=A0A8T0DPV0_9TREM|nr:hypothetical protein P879_01368 [Paragonimus westermani]
MNAGRLHCAINRQISVSPIVKTEELTNHENGTPALSCTDYRQLPWEIPVDYIEQNIPVSSERTCSTNVKTKIDPFPIRTAEHFRSMSAVHFYHKPKFIWGYDTHGAKVRDERRYRILGDTYYCINHPPHYKQMQQKMLHELEWSEETETIERQRSTPKSRDLSTPRLPDPVKQLPPMRSVLRDRPPRKDTSRSSRFVRLSRTDFTTLPLVQRGQQPMRKLYKLANIILKELFPTMSSRTTDRLPRLYEKNDLSALDEVTENDDLESEDSMQQ